MTYKCLECGHIFEEGEQRHWTERQGEFSEAKIGCPLCRGDYEKTVMCEICKAHHLSDKLKGGVCEQCIQTYWNDLDMCFKVGSNDATSIDLNCFLASAFDKEEIEQILFETLKSRQEYSGESVRNVCEGFAKDDLDWFGETLAEEVNKSENTKN